MPVSSNPCFVTSFKSPCTGIWHPAAGEPIGVCPSCRSSRLSERLKRYDELPERTTEEVWRATWANDWRRRSMTSYRSSFWANDRRSMMNYERLKKYAQLPEFLSERTTEEEEAVQFGSRLYLCARKSPYALHPVSQKFPQRCFWNRDRAPGSKRRSRSSKCT